MTVIVQVMLERESRRHLDEFKRRMRTAAAVQQCYYATGEADFILVVIVQDIAEYEEFTQEYFFDESNVSKFTSSIVIEGFYNLCYFSDKRVDDTGILARCNDCGLGVEQLSYYYRGGGSPRKALLNGFAASTEEEIRTGMSLLRECL